MIYLDNAATSFPKAPGAAKAIYDFLEFNGRNINRTNSTKSYETEDSLITLREDIASLLGHKSDETIFLNSGLTESINTCLRGFLKRGDHVIISPIEHNAVMRTLYDLKVDYSYPTFTEDGRINLDDLIFLKEENTKAIVFNISSNVTGSVVDIKKLAEIASFMHLPLIIDSAQALPHIDIKMDENNISAVCFSGHKGLLGPEGTGGFAATEEFAHHIKPLYTGGTGSLSDKFSQPEIFPDKFESGTRNIPSLMGLKEALKYVKENLSELREKEKSNTLSLLSALLSIEGIIVHGPKDENRNNVISITSKRLDNAKLSEILLERYGIETRVGLHCSAPAHRTIGTYPEGTVRLSPGPFTTKDEIEKTIDAIKEVTR